MRVTLADECYLVAHNRLRVCPPAIDLTVLAERLATVRRRYAQAIDLPWLEHVGIRQYAGNLAGVV